MKIVFGIENQFDIRHSELKMRSEGPANAKIGNHKKNQVGLDM